MGLRTVLDQGNATVSAELGHQLNARYSPTVQVRDNNRFDPCLQRSFNFSNRCALGLQINVHEEGLGPKMKNAAAGVHARIGHRCHDIARLDPERTQCQFNGIGAIGHPYGEVHTHIGCKFFFKRGSLRSQHQPSTG